MTSKKILINANSSEVRVAITENGRLAEIYIERESEKSLVGNIYKGKVLRILPGMQSAFIDIGSERAAFLFAGDVLDSNQSFTDPPNDEAFTVSDFRKNSNKKPIEKLLRNGQNIVVQVAKDTIGGKGARVTMAISLPGRYLVLTPKSNHVGVSKKIEDESVRSEIIHNVEEIKTTKLGIIARTSSEGASKEELRKDLNALIERWADIESLATTSNAPHILHLEQDLSARIVRDLYSKDVVSIYVDASQEKERLGLLFSKTIPGAEKKLRLYKKSQPIFDQDNIELDIEKTLSKKVWLPSGGYLIIEQTEALTSIDVNTGKFVGKKNPQDTILKTNLEAIPQIVSQFRLRNIGGIIVLDFIDMETLSNREIVFNKLKEALKADRAKTNLLPINELGLLQLTRKRTSESLSQKLLDDCPTCDGTGRVKSKATICLNLARDLQRICLQKKPNKLKIKMRADLILWIKNNASDLFKDLEASHDVVFSFVSENENEDGLKAYLIMTECN